MLPILAIGVLAFLALLMAKKVTRWIADRQMDPLFAPLPEDEEEKSEDPNAPKREAHKWTVEEQLENKVLTDTPDFELREWLESKYNIKGDEATALITKAQSKRSGSVRGKSAVAMLLSLAVMVGSLRPVLADFKAGEIVLAKDAALLMCMCMSSLFFCRYLIRTITGKTDEPVKS